MRERGKKRYYEKSSENRDSYTVLFREDYSILYFDAREKRNII